MKKILMFILALSALAISACTKIVPIHHVEIQQGNLLTQQQVNQLKLGMTKAQVQQIMGQPILRSTFDPNRWDYVYTMKADGKPYQQQRITVFFKNDRLLKTAGSLEPSS